MLPNQHRLGTPHRLSSRRCCRGTRHVARDQRAGLLAGLLTGLPARKGCQWPRRQPLGRRYRQFFPGSGPGQRSRARVVGAWDKEYGDQKPERANQRPRASTERASNGCGCGWWMRHCGSAPEMARLGVDNQSTATGNNSVIHRRDSAREACPSTARSAPPLPTEQGVGAPIQRPNGPPRLDGGPQGLEA